MFLGNVYFASGGAFEAVWGGTAHASLSAWRSTGQERLFAKDVGSHRDPQLADPGSGAALRAFLRQDPDIIMVGEIRDLETAEIAIKAAQTGHLVLSTLHTNDAPKTLTRLVDMGVKPYAIASSVSLIIAQRLARRLCSNCKEPVDIPAEALLKEGFTQADIGAGMTIYHAKGCSQCNGGYKGRLGIYQVMPCTETIGRIMMEGGNAMQIAAQAKAEGVTDLRQSGLKKVKDGLTSLEEINRVTVE
jgi:type IV pilus assembly protein PilB